MKDKKKFKIITTIIAVILLIFGMVMWMRNSGSSFGESGLFDQETVETKIEEVIGLLDAEDYDTLHEISDEAMKEALTPQLWGDAKVQISEDWGALEKFGDIYLSEAEQQNGEKMAVGQVKVTYENVKVTYTIVFNTDMQLAGLYVK